jgi:3'-5' exonuclease
MANYALFDTETRIDWELAEKIEDADRDEFIGRLREQQGVGPLDDVWVPYTYHLPVVIAVGLIESSSGELTRLGCIKGEDSETICREWWKWIDTFQGDHQKGTLVGFNSRSFDLPVLELAALRFGIPCGQHWNQKYGNRYRYQDDWHVDVLDLLTGHGATRGLRGGLSLASALVGMPVKPAAHSNLYDDVPLERLQAWCRNDVRRLYAVFQRLEFIRGRAKLPPTMPTLEDES